MAIKRIRIDYTVYPPDHKPGLPSWNFRTFGRAKTAAQEFGSCSRIYRNFNRTDTLGVGDSWSGNYCCAWNGRFLERRIDKNNLISRENRDSAI